MLLLCTEVVAWPQQRGLTLSSRCLLCRYCGEHIRRNVADHLKKTAGESMPDDLTHLIRAVPHSRCDDEYRVLMQRIKDMSPSAWEYLSRIPKVNSCHHFGHSQLLGISFYSNCSPCSHRWTGPILPTRWLHMGTPLATWWSQPMPLWAQRRGSSHRAP